MFGRRFVCAVLSLFLALPAMAGESTQAIVINLAEKTFSECLTAAAAFLKENGIPGQNSDKQPIAEQICTQTNPTLVFLKKVEDPKPDYVDETSIDISGGFTAGNVNTANAGGRLAYKGAYKSTAEFEAIFRGEYRLESDSSSYHLFELNTTASYNLNSHWALYVFASIGRDTRKNLAFIARESGGVAYTVFGGPKAPHTLKISVGVGHQYQEPVEGALTGRDAYANNLLFMQYRARHEGKVLKEQLTLIAGVLFQHVLVGLATEDRPARFFDVSDYRIVAELVLRLKIAELFKGVKLYGNLEGNYEYNVIYFGDSPQDLVVKGGLGVSF